MDKLDALKIKYNDFLSFVDYIIGSEHNGQIFSNFKPVSDDKGDISHSIKVLKYVSAYPEYSYLFFGRSGTGKNHLTSAIIQYRILSEIDKGNLACPSIIMTTPFLISEKVRAAMTDKKNSDYVKKCKDAKLLVLNEIGRSKQSDFEKDILFDMIDYRLEKDMQTIFISGMDETELNKYFGVALMDRIKSKCKFIHFDWLSYRKPE